MLEYRFYCCQGVTLQFYETLLEYIEKMERTTLALAKIYPKTVFYYYTKWKQEENPEYASAEHMVQLCDKAIEILRNANRMFYLWELFCMREELAQKLPGTISGSEEFIQRQKDCFNWKETLEELYSEYGISIAMYEFCYLYVESENYCIGDVIRIRRKMLGLSQEKLCKGICDSRTVSRLERNLRKPQKEIVQQLFERLNLSTELCRTELVTDSQEAIEKYRELRVQNINQNFERVDELLAEIAKLVSLENSSNRQVILRNAIINKYDSGCIEKKDYIVEMKKVLSCTIPNDLFQGKKEKYFTNEEISCIQNIMVETDSDEEMKKCMKILCEICDTPKYLGNRIRMYEFVMAAVSSCMGDIGEYEKSSRIKDIIIRLSLYYRRTGGIHEAVYGLLWNDEKVLCKKKQVFEKEKWNVRLEKCISISSLCKEGYRTQIYINKLK